MHLSKQLKPPLENRRNSPVPELAKESEEVGDVVTIEDLVSVPGRFMRPPKMVIILRGPPGSGKTTLAKMIKVRVPGTRKVDLLICCFAGICIS